MRIHGIRNLENRYNKKEKTKQDKIVLLIAVICLAMFVVVKLFVSHHRVSAHATDTVKIATPTNPNIADQGLATSVSEQADHLALFKKETKTHLQAVNQSITELKTMLQKQQASQLLFQQSLQREKAEHSTTDLSI